MRVFTPKLKLPLIILFAACLVGFLIIAASVQAQAPADSYPPPMSLNEGWQYRWGDSPKDEAGLPLWIFDTADNPDWQNMAMVGQPAGRNKNNILWMRVNLPDQTWPDATLFFESTDQGLEAYLEGQLIYQIVNIDEIVPGRALGTPHHLIRLPPDFQNKTIYLRIYSEHTSIGIRGDVFVGSRADHILSILNTEMDRFIMAWVFIVIGVVALVFFLHRLEQKAYLSLAVFAISAGTYIVFRTKLIELFTTDPVLQDYGKITAAMLIPVGLAAFLEQVIGAGRWLIIRRLWQIHLVYAIGAIGLASLGLVPLLSTVLPFEVMAIITTLILVIMTGLTAWQGNVEARFFIAGCGLVLLFAIPEALDDIGLIMSNRSLHWGLFGFIVMLVFILVRRFARVHQMQSELSLIQHELDIARRIQQDLLPPPHLDWAGFDIMCYSTIARRVGGDFYAYHAFPVTTPASGENGQGGRYALAVGDVSGKGMPAALLMAVSLASFQSVVSQALSPAELLTHLDRSLIPYTKTTQQNCALICVELTRFNSPASNDKWGQLRAANAGCIMPLIKHFEGSVEWANVSGMPLGVGLGTEIGYREISLELSKGDMVILTSDGVVEAMNEANEIFGFERLEQAVAAAPITSAEAMLEHLRVEIQAFVGDVELHDDMTIVIVHVQGYVESQPQNKTK